MGLGTDTWIIGLGEARTAARRDDVSITELAWEAVEPALEDAGTSLPEIEGAVTASQDFWDGRTISSMSVNELVGGVFGSEAKVASDAALGLGYALARMEDEDQHLNLFLAHAKESQGDIHTIELAAFDPYFQRQLGPDDTVVAAFQAQLLYGEDLFEPSHSARVVAAARAQIFDARTGQRPGRARLSGHRRPAAPARPRSAGRLRLGARARRRRQRAQTRAHRRPDRRRRFAHRRVLEPAARASHRAGGPRGRRGGAVDRRLGAVRARRDRDQRAVRAPAPDHRARARTRLGRGARRAFRGRRRRPGRERVGRMARRKRRQRRRPSRGRLGRASGCASAAAARLVHATTGIGCQSHHVVLLEAAA